MLELKDYTPTKFIMFHGECLALFRDTKRHNGYGTVVESYAHIGQHSDASASLLRCKPALPHEYKALAAELEGRGYNLIILNKPDTSANLFRAIAQDYNAKHDPWGYAMAAAFDIAAACYMRGVPCALDYHPGAGGPAIEDPWNRRKLMRLSAKKLERLATFTKRVLDMLERNGKDY